MKDKVIPRSTAARGRTANARILPLMVGQMQAQDDFLRQFFAGPAGCVHGEISGAVERKALRVKGAKDFGRSREWPRALWRVRVSGPAALVQFLDLCFQENHPRPPASQQFYVRWLDECASSQRNHCWARRLLQDHSQGFSLDLAKTGLAAQLEYFADQQLLSQLNFVVEVEGRPAEKTCQSAAHSGFASAHVPRQRNYFKAGSLLAGLIVCAHDSGSNRCRLWPVEHEGKLLVVSEF
jgi:hypothetical protein